MQLNTYEIDGNVTRIIHRSGVIAIIDTEDILRAKAFNWYPTKKGSTKYFSGGFGPNKLGKIFLHRLILSFPSSIVDHKNGDGLDNRKTNIRECSFSQNLQNQKRDFKGVSWDYSKYTARIFIEGKKITIGRFDTKQEAALAYNEAALKHFGEYARLNIINKEVYEADSTS